MVLSLWRAQRTRKRVAAIIAPLVEGSRFRLGGIADSAWSDPYVIGFLAMLITRLAEQQAGAMDNDTLALVQAGAWADVTGQGEDTIGENLVLLSSANDMMFEQGCRNGRVVADALGCSLSQAESVDAEEAPWMASPGQDDVGLLWADCFEARLTSR
ncbi:MAG: hypothetical protein HC900_13545 [Methylacidiphilales bacterium]|nr:hypothetical protein [Candidatus Methylacidiphilales bacterium]